MIQETFKVSVYEYEPIFPGKKPSDDVSISKDGPDQGSVCFRSTSKLDTHKKLFGLKCPRI